MDKNTERLIAIAKRRSEIEKEVKEANDEAVLEQLEQEVRALNEETIEIRKAFVEKSNQEGKEIEMKPEKEERKVNVIETVEYREAFRDYAMGKNSKVLKMRADATTVTTDVAAIIPTTILNRVVQELKDYGEIMPLVTMINIQGGVEVPVGGTKPTASWVAEGSVADKQIQEVKAKVTFSYHKLQIRVAATLLADVVSLDIWEQIVAQNIAEAMAVALETSIITGSGSGQPLGIVNDLASIPAANKVDFAVADATYTGWLTKLIGSIPLAYRKRRSGVILMNPLTWDKYCQGLIDDQGQPVARVSFGINNEETLRLFGKRVILTELLPDLDGAITDDAGDVVVIYGDFSNYMMNSNMQITYRQYFDEDLDEYVRKATLIVDGKLVDPNGFVILSAPTA